MYCLKKVIWSHKASSAIVPPAMDGNKKRIGNDANRRDGSQSGPHPYAQSEELYERYCEYAEASRTALLRVVLNPDSRRSIAQEEPVLSKDEFVIRLNRMPEAVREAFIGRIQAGYQQARTEYGSYLAAIRRRAG